MIKAEKIIMAIVYLLAIDLWGVHAKLLYQLNPDKIGDITQTFSYIAMNENTITAMLFSLVFAFVPVLVLTTISPKVEQYWLFVLIFALFDGGSWFIYYNKTAIGHFETWGAGYYGFFILFIVLSIGFIRMRIQEIEDEQKTKEEPKPINDEDVRQVLKDTAIVDFFKEAETTKTMVDPTDETIIDLLSKGMTGKRVAEKVGLNPSTITRKKQKFIKDGRLQA